MDNSQFSKIINFHNIKFEHIYKYNENENDVLDNEILNIKFSHDFNDKITRLPIKLICLILGDCFNQNVDLLPESLKYLQLGKSFNKKLDDLPSSLKILEFNISCFYYYFGFHKLDYEFLINDSLHLNLNINKSMKLNDNSCYYEIQNEYNQQTNILPSKLRYILISKSKKKLFNERYRNLICDFITYGIYHHPTGHVNLSRIDDFYLKFGKT